MYKSALHALYLYIKGWIEGVHYMATAKNRTKE